MALTQEYITTELDFAKKVFLYYTDKMLDYSAIGSNKYLKWFSDSMQLYSIVKYLENVIVDAGSYYIGAVEVSEDSVKDKFERTREYYKSDIDIDYEFIYEDPRITPTYIQPYVADWKEFTVTITSDNTTQVSIPVSIDIMDKESLHLTVNVISNPSYNDDDSKAGYHIIGNTLYWHDSNPYNLMAGATLRLQYLQIVG